MATLTPEIAVNRFGLGARPGELALAARNPQAWLETQLGALEFDGAAGSSTAVLEQAVSTTLGAPSPPVGALEVPPTPAPLWRTVELAPGVLVTLDLARVADPEALLNRLSQSITALHP